MRTQMHVKILLSMSQYAFPLKNKEQMACNFTALYFDVK